MDEQRSWGTGEEHDHGSDSAMDALCQVTHTDATLNVHLLARALGIDTALLAPALRTDHVVLAERPEAPELQPVLHALAQILARLSALMCGDVPAVRMWLAAPHPDLDLRRPLDYLCAGKLEPLVSLIAGMEARHAS